MKIVASNTTPLCYMPDGRLVCYRHGDIIVYGESNEMSFSLFASFNERIIGRCRLAYRLLRLGIRAALAIDDNHIVFSIKNYLYELDIESGKLSKGYYCGEGIRPLIFSQVREIEGFDNGLYFGGYIDNMDKKPVHIYKRIGTDQWEIIYTFSQGTINHIHNIIPDPYRHCLWIFTGDFDEAAAIWKVTDNFKQVERVLCNNQKYRGCVAYALPEGLLYATDAPFADNFIYLLNPKDISVKKIFPISGSCIYGCQWKDKFVFSSTVEGDMFKNKIEFLFSRNKGVGIKDYYIHMYMGSIQEGFNEIYKEEKDCMPIYSFQFGVFKFPCGDNYSNSLFFQPVATKHNDLNLLVFKQ